MPAYNAADTIGDQLLALAGQGYDGDWELVIADNGSSDDTASVAREWAGVLPAVVIVDAGQRPGANYARNVGIGAAKGDLLLLIDADDVVGAGWLQHMCDAARSFDHFSGRFVHFDVNPPKLKITHGPLKTFDFMPAAWGGNQGVWRDVADAVGGYNELLLGGGEDLEFSWRLQLLGYSFGWVPDAIVFHRLRPDLRGLFRQRYRYGKADGLLSVEFANEGLEAWNDVYRAWRKIRLRWRGAISSLPDRRSLVTDLAWLTGFANGWVRGSWQRGARGGAAMGRR